MREEKVIVKKGGFFGKLLIFILAFILGVVATVGGVVGVGYWYAKNKKVKDIFNLAGVDYSAYLSDEYAEKTVWNAVGSAVSDLSGLSNGSLTLGDINAISPFVGDKVDAVCNSVADSFGVALNEEGAMLNVPLNELSDYVKRTIEETPIVNVLEKFGTGNDIITAVCYGIEGEDYEIDENGNIVPFEGYVPLTIKDFASEELNERIKKLPVDALITIDFDDKLMCALLYGHESHYEIVEINGELQAKMNQEYYTLVDGVWQEDKEPVSVTSSTPVGEDFVVTLEDGRTQYLQKDGDKYLVFEGVEDEHGAIVAGKSVYFKKTTMQDLQDGSNDLLYHITLADALEVDHTSHPVLVSLAYGKEGVDFRYQTNVAGEKIGIEIINEPRSLGYFRDNNQSMLDDVSLSSVIDADLDSALVMYVLYGKENVHYQISGNEVTPLIKKVAVKADKVYDAYGDLIAGATVYCEAYTGTPIAYSIYENGKRIRYTLAQTDFAPNEKRTITVDGTELEYYHVYLDGVAVLYESTTIGDLTGESTLISKMTARLTLGEVVDVNDNRILAPLKDTTIDELPDAINQLTVGDVFEKDVYYTNANGDYTLSDQTTVVDESQKVMRPMWKYMLMEKDEDTPHLDYYITTQINDMIDNVQDNIQTRQLNQLLSDGIIDPESAQSFGRKIPAEITLVPGYEQYAGKTLGELNIHDLVHILNLMTSTWSE